MGRGRAKAKQTKVARRLKYYSPETDLNALERELRSEDGGHYDPSGSAEESDDASVDDHAGDGDDDYEAWASGQR